MSDQSNAKGIGIASEQGHWYTKQGEACYEVPRAKGDGMRPTTLADARKLGLVPSVTTILACAAKPGLEAWKARQILESALTLPQLASETLDDYAERVIEDSKAQGKKAAERGTELHKAIEDWIRGQQNLLWIDHCVALNLALQQYGIDITKGKPEHSFASPLGYGGKIDWHNDEICLDFKTKAKVKDVKQLAWPEHGQQLAAYSFGLGPTHWENTRLVNVFIGTEDCEVRVHEWPKEGLLRNWKAFKCLLDYWKITKNYTP